LYSSVEVYIATVPPLSFIVLMWYLTLREEDQLECLETDQKNIYTQ